MAYGGYLIKVGDYKVPFEYITASTFQSPLLGQDLNSYNDDNGELHRDALKNQVLKAEWQVPGLTEKKFDAFMSKINAQYVGQKGACNCLVPRDYEVCNNVLLCSGCYDNRRLCG